jgi:5-methylcytosine-specific restriction endonuclease McrA
MTLKEQIINLRKQGLLYPEIVDALGCNYDYVKRTCQKNNLNYLKDELAKRSGEFKPYKDWQKAVDDYYGGPGIAEVIEQHRASNGETKVTVRCVKCGDIKDLSSITLRKNHQGRCLECQHRKKASDKLALEWDSNYQHHVDGVQVGMRFCQCGELIPSDKHGKTKLCDNCRIENERLQKKKENKKRELLRRHRMSGGDWSINLEELFKRDHGLCYLCERTCDWSDYEMKDGAFVAGNNYPSIDHVIPLAKGGKHEWSNVRLACRLCNSKKRDVIPVHIGFSA